MSKLKIGNTEIDLAAWEVKAGGLLLPASEPVPLAFPTDGYGPPAPGPKITLWKPPTYAIVKPVEFVAFDPALADYVAMIEKSIVASLAISSGLFNVKTYSNGGYSTPKFTMENVKEIAAKFRADTEVRRVREAKAAWIAMMKFAARNRAFVAWRRGFVGWLWPERN